MATPPEVRKRLRVSAYAICIRDVEVLLARYIEHPPPLWTLPGGGVEHGEDPADAVLPSARHQYDRHYGVEDQHALRILYEVDVIGGTLRNEVGGTTDLACWFPLDGVSELDRASLVDIGLSMRISC